MAAKWGCWGGGYSGRVWAGEGRWQVKLAFPRPQKAVPDRGELISAEWSQRIDKSSLSAKGRIHGNNGNYNCLSVCQKLCQVLYVHCPDCSTQQADEIRILLHGGGSRGLGNLVCQGFIQLLNHGVGIQPDMALTVPLLSVFPVL